MLADLTVSLVIEELNEEDQQLKNELEMLVERLHVGCRVVCTCLELGIDAYTTVYRSRIRHFTSLRSKLSRLLLRPPHHQ